MPQRLAGLCSALLCHRRRTEGAATTIPACAAVRRWGGVDDGAPREPRVVVFLFSPAEGIPLPQPLQRRDSQAGTKGQRQQQDRAERSTACRPYKARAFLLLFPAFASGAVLCGCCYCCCSLVALVSAEEATDNRRRRGQRTSFARSPFDAHPQPHRRACRKSRAHASCSSLCVWQDPSAEEQEQEHSRWCCRIKTCSPKHVSLVSSFMPRSQIPSSPFTFPSLPAMTSTLDLPLGDLIAKVSRLDLQMVAKTSG
jgi:hypothetical protein